MNKAPLLEELLKYKNENNLILSMPGNKSGKAFKDTLGKLFKENLGELDITEVDPLDNLHNPEGIIKEAQELLAKTYKVKKAYFLVNGSSSGNLAAIFSAFNEGDEILVERNCHKSIYNAIVLRKLKVIYINSIIDERLGIFLPPTEEEIIDALNRGNNPKGIILTSPNYFGIYNDNIEKIIKKIKSKNLKVIIDSAHGAHFGFNERLPKSMSNLGDYVVVSAHKTLPSLTQGAFLLVNDYDNNLEFYLRAFMTTSPSYLIMASLDYSRYYLDNYANKDYERLIKISEKYKDKINLLNKVFIVSNNELENNYGIDKSRYLVILKDGFSGHKFLDYLRSKNIQAEMSFNKGVVLILSPSNTIDDFEKLYLAINELDLNILKDNKNKIQFNRVYPKKILEPYEVFKFNYKYLNLNEAINKISKDFIVPYPPGIPIVCPGELITNEIISLIQNFLNNKLNVIGIEDNKIKVIDN